MSYIIVHEQIYKQLIGQFEYEIYFFLARESYIENTHSCRVFLILFDIRCNFHCFQWKLEQKIQQRRRIVLFLLRGRRFETKKNVKFYCWQRSIRRTVIFLDLLSLPSDFNFLWASRNRRDLDPLRVKRGEMA